jgi:hypothetical protein
MSETTDDQGAEVTIKSGPITVRIADVNEANLQDIENVIAMLTAMQKAFY